MDTKDSGLISALESFWNGWATARAEKDVILIVCASATYWMIKNIVNAKGGLHNRLTGQVFLKPFALHECEEYLQSKKIIFNRHQILQCYMIMGGVPYYWNLFSKPDQYVRIVEALSTVNKGITRDKICEITGISGVYTEVNACFEQMFVQNLTIHVLRMIMLLLKLWKNCLWWRGTVYNGWNFGR